MSFLLVLLCAVPETDTAAIRLRRHPWGLPRSADSALILLRNIAYDCGYSPRLRVARWAAYFYTPSPAAGRARYAGRFSTDPRLGPDRSATPADYRGAYRRDLAGFDRGHLAPDASLKVFGAQAQAETYYLTNIAPQHSRVNRGPWLELEDLVRSTTGPGETTWVIVGPVYLAGRDTLWLGRRVAVPHAFYAVSARKNPARPVVWLVPNVADPPPGRQAESWRVPLDSVRRLTGLALLPRARP